MGERKLVVGYESALEFWRGVRAAGSVPDSGVASTFGRGHEQPSKTARRALSLCGLEPPLRVVIPSKEHRHNSPLIEDHVCAVPVGGKQCVVVDRDVLVSPPGATLVQLSRSLDEIDLARIAYEFCGTYGIGPDGEALQDLRPLVGLTQLKADALGGRALKVRGSDRLCSALQLVADDSNSPEETDVGIFLSMTRARGGMGLEGFEMNVEIELPAELQRLVGATKMRPDFFWAARRVILEYESRKHHSSAEAMERDERRRRAFEAAGFYLRRLTWDILQSDTQLNIFMSELASHIDPRRRAASDAMLEKRRDLRSRLFGPPLQEEVLLDLAVPYTGRIL